MALTFYFGSGSPFAWKVWLTLEHKGIAYTPKRLSFDEDETQEAGVPGDQSARPGAGDRR